MRREKQIPHGLSPRRVLHIGDEKPSDRIRVNHDGAFEARAAPWPTGNKRFREIRVPSEQSVAQHSVGNDGQGLAYAAHDLGRCRYSLAFPVLASVGLRAYASANDDDSAQAGKIDRRANPSDATSKVYYRTPVGRRNSGWRNSSPRPSVWWFRPVSQFRTLAVLAILPAEREDVPATRKQSAKEPDLFTWGQGRLRRRRRPSRARLSSKAASRASIDARCASTSRSCRRRDAISESLVILSISQVCAIPGPGPENYWERDDLKRCR